MSSVALYSVDLTDGDKTVYDTEGQEAASAEVARDEAVRLLTEVARAGIMDGEDHLIVGIVKNDTGEAVYRVTLALTCTRLQ